MVQCFGDLVVSSKKAVFYHNMWPQHASLLLEISPVVGNRDLGFECWLCHLPTLWPGTSCLTSGNFHFLIPEKEITVSLGSKIVVGIKWCNACHIPITTLTESKHSQLLYYIVVAIVDVTIITIIYWLPHQLSSGKLEVIIKESSPCYHWWYVASMKGWACSSEHWFSRLWMWVHVWSYSQLPNMLGKSTPINSTQASPCTSRPAAQEEDCPECPVWIPCMPCSLFSKPDHPKHPFYIWWKFIQQFLNHALMEKQFHFTYLGCFYNHKKYNINIFV